MGEISKEQIEAEQEALEALDMMLEMMHDNNYIRFAWYAGCWYAYSQRLKKWYSDADRLDLWKRRVSYCQYGVTMQDVADYCSKYVWNV